MKRTLRQWYNHKIKNPGSVSAYTVQVGISANAQNQQELNEAVMDIIPGLGRYLLDRGFLLTTPLLTREEEK